ncbi:AraC family transcriptional regulator [Domibacillus enclensis]|uniref:AraC family transcriptional regulator n=1 Tax=Domibacillus enclensis TaxID=1017273 RepID=A0A1N6NZU0_9BACI|nr:AraC family transcriptional regulator [Domibacillus enclensis]OXS80196.1 AraC family transcriptional regulator [Domibacillus enclensis]SIP97624.1 transcriptional regulator, AraC family [Domibacillus enclensis]
MKPTYFTVDRTLKEETVHRTVVLPVACYETEICHHFNGFIPLHWHEEVQFVYVLKGEAVFRVNEEDVRVVKGDGLFINSGAMHMAEDRENSQCRYLCLNVSPHFLLPQELYPAYVEPYIRADNLAHVPIYEGDQWGSEVLKSMLLVHHLLTATPSYYEIDTAAQLGFMWKTMMANGLPLEYEQVDNGRNERMKQMLNWIHDHYEEKIGLEDIAKAGNLSRSECCRSFSRMLKKPPMRYVTDYRLQKSLALLQKPDSTVTEVAYQVGFNSTSYFIGTFRKAFGITPLVYKKKLKKKGDEKAG